jgi:Ca2+-binding EF-hand superfamily protein
MASTGTTATNAGTREIHLSHTHTMAATSGGGGEEGGERRERGGADGGVLSHRPHTDTHPHPHSSGTRDPTTASVHVRVGGSTHPRDTQHLLATRVWKRKSAMAPTTPASTAIGTSSSTTAGKTATTTSTLPKAEPTATGVDGGPGANTSSCSSRSSRPTVHDVSKLHGYLSEHNIAELVASTNYTRRELYTMFVRFKALCTLSPLDGLGVDRKTFQNGIARLAIEDNVFVDRVFASVDVRNSGSIEWHEYISAMTALEKGSLKHKCKFGMAIYDLDGDGFLSRSDLTTMFLSSSMLQLDHTTQDVGDAFVDALFKTVRVWCMRLCVSIHSSDLAGWCGFPLHVTRNACFCLLARHG